jgi:hypothetical protein
MAHINDLMFAFFRGLGYTGALPDMRYEWLKDNGYSSMRAAMAAEGFSSGSIADFMFSFFTDTGFNPTSLFASNEEGAFYDFSNLATLRQNSDGTTAVVDWGDPVGFVLDQSKGSSTLTDNLGPELVSNGSFDSDTSSWSAVSGATLSQVGGRMRVQAGAGDAIAAAGQDIASQLVAGKVYRFSIDITEWSANDTGAASVRIGLSSLGASSTYDILDLGAIGTGNILQGDTGTFSGYFVYSGGTIVVGVAAINGGSSSAEYVEVDNISVRELPGNHLTQSTAPSRPRLARVPVGGRRNLLLYTEQFDNAVWLDSGGASITAGGVITGLTGISDYVEQRFDVSTDIDGRTFSGAVEVRGAGANIGKNVDVFARGAGGTFAGSSGAVTLTGDWQRVSRTFTGASGTLGASLRVRGAGSNPASSVEIRFPQLEESATPTPYQKVTAAYDITESGKADVVGLYFDGVDDYLVSPSIDLTGTDEATMAAAFLQYATPGVNAKPFVHKDGTPGQLRHLFEPDNEYSVWSSGTTSRNEKFAIEVNAPYSAIQRADISEPILSLNVSGFSEGIESSTQGTGNYSDGAFYVGSFSGSNPANMFCASCLLIDRYITDEETTELETYLEGKAGVE